MSKMCKPERCSGPSPVLPPFSFLPPLSLLLPPSLLHPSFFLPPSLLHSSPLSLFTSPTVRKITCLSRWAHFSIILRAVGNWAVPAIASGHLPPCFWSHCILIFFLFHFTHQWGTYTIKFYAHIQISRGISTCVLISNIRRYIRDYHLVWPMLHWGKGWFCICFSLTVLFIFLLLWFSLPCTSRCVAVDRWGRELKISSPRTDLYVLFLLHW